MSADPFLHCECFLTCRPPFKLKLKNQAQSRKFDIAHLKTTPVCRGMYGNSLRTYLQESQSSSTKENTKIFKKCVPKKHTSSIASSRRGSKNTLCNWLRLVADRKTRILIFHGDIQLDRTAVPFSPRPRTTKVALIKATKYKANLATGEVRLENRNRDGLGNNKTFERLLS